MLMQLTAYELNGHAHFLSDAAFVLKTIPPQTGEIPTGRYELPRRSGEAQYYRLAHPLAQHVLTQARAHETPTAVLTFDYSNAPNKISVLEQLPVKAGWLRLSRLTIESLSQTEDHLIWAGVTADGRTLDDAIWPRLFALPGQANGLAGSPPDEMVSQTDTAQQTIRRQISRRNAELFEAEINKLEAWADDRKVALEREIKEYDRRIKETRRAALAALTLEEKLALQKEVKALEKERTTRRRSLFEAQDEIDTQRDQIINDTESRMVQTYTVDSLFCVRWRLV
jgi:adenine-specific DNA-methyltransferase